jgi:hypothetical protein
VRFNLDESILWLLQRDSPENVTLAHWDSTFTSCVRWEAFDDQPFPVSLLKSVTLIFKRLVAEAQDYFQ